MVEFHRGTAITKPIVDWMMQLLLPWHRRMLEVMP
jgi:hypothetical protein